MEASTRENQLTPPTTMSSFGIWIGRFLIVGLAMLLGGVTCAATGMLMFADVGARVGFVIGLIIGCLGGRAASDLILKTRTGRMTLDTYSSRKQHELPAYLHNSVANEVSNTETKQANREAWHLLDQSSKELLDTREPTESGSP